MKRISRNLMGVIIFLLLATTSSLFAADYVGKSSYVFDGWNAQADGLVTNSGNRATTISAPRLTPALDITRFGGYKLSVDVIPEGQTVNNVKFIVSPQQASSTNLNWVFLTDGSANPDPTTPLSINSDSIKDNTYSLTRLRPDDIYPQIGFIKTIPGAPLNSSTSVNNYDLLHYQNPIEIGTKTTFFIEINATPGSSSSRGLQVYLVGKGLTIDQLKSNAWKTSSSVELVGTIDRAATVNHSHGSNSQHHLIALSTKPDGTIGSKSLDISGDFWVILYTDHPSANRNWNVKYHADGNNNGNWWKGSGSTFTNPSGRPDVHVHFAREEPAQEYNKMKVYANVTFTDNLTVPVQGPTQTFSFSALPALPPNPSTFKLPTAGRYNKGDNVTVEWYPSIDPNNDLATYSLYRIYNGDTTLVQAGLTSTTYNLNTTGYANGNYDLMVKAIDTGGLKSAFLLSSNYDTEQGETFTIATPLSGTKTVGTGVGQDYPSLTQAGGLFEAINYGILSGDIIANITSNLTETGAIALNQWTESGTYTLTIQPSDATERTISGSSATNLISLNGADRVTINGNKKLTFSNSNTAGTVISLDNNAANNTITNCIIKGAAAKGINIGNAPSATISKNKIYDLTGDGTNNVTGIDCNGTNTGSLAIENNMISLSPNTTGTAIVTGINCNGTLATLNLYYNSINLTGTQTANSFAFYKNNTTTTCNVKNNLFQNIRTGSGNSYAVGLINNDGIMSQDYNLLHSANEKVGVYVVADKTNLETWINDTPYDDHSQSGIITFITSSTGELKFSNIFANVIVYNKGTPITGIETDFYGTARQFSEVPGAYDKPDIGAYEFAQPLGVNDDLIPLTTSLSQNYPNPFNPETAIKFALAKDAKIDLTIYNIKGEVVKSLVNNNYKAGYHSVNFNATGLNSGVYIYKLVTPEQSFVKKMIMVK